ncbi:MAG: 2'-5' RNA ligase family protein [Microbacterium sp.]
MSDIVSIELLLDPGSETRVRADWQRLAAAGLSSMGAHTSPSNRPHITLLVRPFLGTTAFDEAVAMLPVELTLGPPVVFRHGDRGVLARQVTPTAGLLALHRIVHRAAGPGPDAAHTAPGEWTPHVTLARRIRIDSLDDALRLLGPEFPATGTALRRWDSASATVSPIRPATSTRSDS